MYSQKWFKNENSREMYLCPKLVKDKYLAKLHVSTTSTTEKDNDEASEIENWLFDFSTSSAKPIPKKPKQIDAHSTLVHFADKMSTSEQEKLNALLVRAMYASGTPFCMVENSHRKFTFFKGEFRPNEAIYHKIHHKILRLCKKNELATFYSFDEIRKKLREPQVDSDWLTL